MWCPVIFLKTIVCDIGHMVQLSDIVIFVCVHGNRTRCAFG